MKHDLSKLCNQMVILVELHEWYNTLPTSARAISLPASTIDDSGDNDDNTLI